MNYQPVLLFGGAGTFGGCTTLSSACFGASLPSSLCIDCWIIVLSTELCSLSGIIVCNESLACCCACNAIICITCSVRKESALTSSAPLFFATTWPLYCRLITL